MSVTQPTTSVVAPEQVDSLLQVVDLVRTGHARTRPDLIRRTGLGRSIVDQRVDQARELGLLVRGPLGASHGGRAPRLLTFPVDRGCFVAILFGARALTLAVSDLGGTVRWQLRGAWDVAAGPAASLEHAERLVQAQLAEVATPVWGVAVGLPGPVEFRTGRPTAPPIMPGWDGYDVRSRLEQRFGAPVWVDNDVNLLAQGEIAQHAGGDLVFVKVGTGIGAGIVSDGRVHRGMNGAAGDIGHVRVPGYADVRCRCGRTGCLEAVAGGWALARDAAEAAAAGRSPFAASRIAETGSLSPVDVADGANRGDPLCAELVDRSAALVGESIAGLVNLLNPGVVAIGGTIADAGAQFLAEVRQAVYARSLPLATRDLRIVPASSGGGTGLDGAFALLRAQVFARVVMSRWVPWQSPLAVDPASLYSSPF